MLHLEPSVPTADIVCADIVTTSEAAPVGWAGGFKSTELWPHWALSSRCDVLEPLEPKWHMARRSYEMICALFQASLVLYHKSLQLLLRVPVDGNQPVTSTQRPLSAVGCAAAGGGRDGWGGTSPHRARRSSHQRSCTCRVGGWFPPWNLQFHLQTISLRRHSLLRH